MSFVQEFGATIIALLCYIIVLFAISLIFGAVEDYDDDAITGCAVIGGCVLFVVMFLVWYTGVPVPEWLK